MISFHDWMIAYTKQNNGRNVHTPALLVIVHSLPLDDGNPIHLGHQQNAFKEEHTAHTLNSNMNMG